MPAIQYAIKPMPITHADIQANESLHLSDDEPFDMALSQQYVDTMYGIDDLALLDNVGASFDDDDDNYYWAVDDNDNDYCE